MVRIARPGAGDFAPYYSTYVELVETDDVLDTLGREGRRTSAMLRRVPAELESYRYAPDKWSVREVVAHLIDTERVFAYRALSFARGDAGPLPGMDQDQWNAEGGASGVPLATLADEFEAVRAATLTQFGRFDETALNRRGVASGVEFAVRAFPWVMAGHEIHHRRILIERYGLSEGPGD